MKIITTIVLALSTANVFGDLPLPPPTQDIFKSTNGKIEAVTDPKNGITIRDSASKEVLWRIPEWHRQVFIANDGIHAITIYNGSNLLPLNFDSKTILFTFWKLGLRVRDVPVWQVAPTSKSLRRTESHFEWGMPLDISSHFFRVKTAGGDILSYDLSSGERVDAEQGAAANP